VCVYSRLGGGFKGLGSRIQMSVKKVCVVCVYSRMGGGGRGLGGRVYGLGLSISGLGGCVGGGEGG